MKSKMQHVTVLDIITPASILICIYCIGLYLHLKVIKVSKKEKELTWRLDVTNSYMVMCHHAHVFTIEIVTYIVPDIHTYTGEWFCYFSKLVTLYGNYYIIGHSMIIAIFKYVIIVCWEKARDVGHEKIKGIFFWYNLVYSVTMFLPHFLYEPEYLWVHDSFARIDRCLGDPKNNWGPDSNRTQIKMHHICKRLTEAYHQDYIWHALNNLRAGTCWVHVLVCYLVGLNIIEMLVYCRIFSFMRR